MMTRENDCRIKYSDKLLMLRLSIDNEEAEAGKRDTVAIGTTVPSSFINIDNNYCCWLVADDNEWDLIDETLVSVCSFIV